MKPINSKSIFIISSIAIHLFFSQCKSNWDPYMLNFNLPYKGKVLDKNTNEPIKEATIRIWIENSYYSDTLVYLTNDDGIFITEELSNYGSGEKVFEFSKQPYFVTMEIIENEWSFELESGDTIRIPDILLKPAIYGFKVVPDTLFFRNDQKSLSFSILNTGSGILNWEINISDNWISADIISGQTASNEFDIVKIIVSRLNLVPGNYISSIEINTNVGKLAIPVYASVN